MQKKVVRLPARAVAIACELPRASYGRPFYCTIAVVVALLVMLFSVVLFADDGDKDVQAKKPTPPAIKLEIASFAQIQEAVAKHKGKVVVVKYWSTYCPPCVKELPEFVQLHKDFADKKEFADKVVCLTVDCDFAGIEGEKPEEHQENVLGILTQHQAIMRNFISSDPDMTVYKKLQAASVPVMQVYDRTGKLHKRFDNETDAYGKEGYSVLKHVKPVVLELLK